MGLAPRKLLPVVGAVTAAATTVVGFAPMVVSAQPAEPSSDGFDAAAEPAADGVYESCSAYFGFGKSEGAAELVEFQVGVDGTGPGPAPTVENGGVEVVLVIENDEDDVVVCVPEEVTAEQWDDEYGDTELNVPPYPGPGHYVYPSAGIGTPLLELGVVTEVGFVVTGIAEGYTLTSPVGIEPLATIFTNPFFDLEFGELDPVVLGIIAQEAGDDAVDAYVAALEGCVDEIDPTPSEELSAAVDALVDFVVAPGGLGEIGEINCSVVVELYFLSSLLVDAYETTTNAEAIVLGVVTTPTTAAPTATTATPAAQPAVVTPRFTG